MAEATGRAVDFFSLSPRYREQMSEHVRNRRGVVVEYLEPRYYGFRHEFSPMTVQAINGRIGANVSKQTIYLDARAFQLAAAYLQGKGDWDEYQSAERSLRLGEWVTRPLAWLIQDGFNTWEKIEAALGRTVESVASVPMPPAAPAEEVGIFVPEAGWTGVVNEQGGALLERMDQLLHDFDELRDDLVTWRRQVKDGGVRVKLSRTVRPVSPKHAAPSTPEPLMTSVRMRLEIPDTCAFFSNRFELAAEVEKYDFPRLDVADLALVSRMLESLSSGGPRHPNLLSRRVDVAIRARNGERKADFWISEYGLVRALWKLNGNCRIQRVWKRGWPDLLDYDRCFDAVVSPTAS